MKRRILASGSGSKFTAFNSIYATWKSTITGWNTQYRTEGVTGLSTSVLTSRSTSTMVSPDTNVNTSANTAFNTQVNTAINTAWNSVRYTGWSTSAVKYTTKIYDSWVYYMQDEGGSGWFIDDVELSAPGYIGTYVGRDGEGYVVVRSTYVEPSTSVVISTGVNTGEALSRQTAWGTSNLTNKNTSWGTVYPAVYKNTTTSFQTSKPIVNPLPYNTNFNTIRPTTYVGSKQTSNLTYGPAINTGFYTTYITGWNSVWNTSWSTLKVIINGSLGGYRPTYVQTSGYTSAGTQIYSSWNTTPQVNTSYSTNSSYNVNTTVVTSQETVAQGGAVTGWNTTYATQGNTNTSWNTQQATVGITSWE